MDRWQIMQVIDCRLREIGQDPDRWSVLISNRVAGLFELQMETWPGIGGRIVLDPDTPPSQLRAVVDEMVCTYVPAINAGAMPS
jgi:hypothetical protein